MEAPAKADRRAQEVHKTDTGHYPVSLQFEHISPFEPKDSRYDTSALHRMLYNVCLSNVAAVSSLRLCSSPSMRFELS